MEQFTSPETIQVEEMTTPVSVPLPTPPKPVEERLLIHREWRILAGNRYTATLDGVYYGRITQRELDEQGITFEQWKAHVIGVLKRRGY